MLFIIKLFYIGMVQPKINYNISATQNRMAKVYLRGVLICVLN